MPSEFKNGRAMVARNGLRFVIDTKGVKIFELPKNYPLFLEFNENVAPILLKYPKDALERLRSASDGEYENVYWNIITSSAEWGCVDINGKIVFKGTFVELGRCSEGLVRARRAMLWGYVNKRGEWVIPPIFKDCGDFHEGRAWVVPKKDL